MSGKNEQLLSFPEHGNLNGKTIKLPNTWTCATFGDVCKIQSGYAFRSQDYQEIGILLVRISNLVEGNVEISSNSVFLPENYLDKFSEYCLRNDDVLIAMSGATTGKMATYNLTSSAFLNQRVGRFVITAPALIDVGYLAKLVKTISEKVLQLAYGGAQPNISSNEIEKFLIPLPPLNEQRRIVAKIEALRVRTQRVKEEIEAIPALLHQFRQSVLAAAFRGDLTADWREKNPDVEPASVLLERIRSDRRQVAKNVCAEALDKTDLPALPNGWLWVPLEAIAIHKSGVAFKSIDFTNKGIQVVRLGNIYKGQLDLTRDPVYLPEELVLDNFILKPGHISVSQTGTRFKRDYGHFVVIPEGSPKLLLNQRLLAIICHPLIEPKYIMFASKLKVYQEHFFFT